MRSNVFRATPSNTHAQSSSTSTSDVKTVTAPDYAQAFVVTAETTAAYMTIDGSTTPSSSAGLYIPIGVAQFFPFGAGMSLKFASTSSTAAKLNFAWLT